MPLETLEQPNIRELITDRPEKRPYIFNPDKDITAADWELMLPDLPKDLQSGAWISILDPQRTALLDNEHWLGQAFNRAGWASLQNSERHHKKYLEMFFYAHLISPTKYPLDLNKRNTEVMIENVRDEIAGSLTLGLDLETTMLNFIVWNARLKILSDGNILPLRMSKDEQDALKKYLTERFLIEKKRSAISLLMKTADRSYVEVIFSLKVAYPELCQFPEEVTTTLRDWLSEARESEIWHEFLDFALALYVLSAKEIKVVGGRPVFIVEEPTPVNEPTPLPPAKLNF